MPETIQDKYTRFINAADNNNKFTLMIDLLTELTADQQNDFIAAVKPILSEKELTALLYAIQYFNMYKTPGKKDYIKTVLAKTIYYQIINIQY